MEFNGNLSQLRKEHNWDSKKDSIEYKGRVREDRVEDKSLELRNGWRDKMQAVDTFGELSPAIANIVSIGDSGLGINYEFKRGKVEFHIDARLYYVMLTENGKTPIDILKQAIKQAYDRVK